MKIKDKNSLKRLLRERIVYLASKSQTAHPHIGSCLSCIDILIQTFIYEMKPEDKFVLSKGHASLALYVVLNYLDKVSTKKLEQTYLAEGTQFGIHTPNSLPKDIPLATGSLGHGLSFAAGVAKGFRLLKQRKRVFCLLSDGECNEGAVWEAALFASHQKLSNLIVMIDKNGIQAFGRTKEVLGDAASKEKWKAFGFAVYECDGHNFKDMEKVFKQMGRVKQAKPTVVILHTVRGKGIRSIENKIVSNYTTVDTEFYKKALSDIRKMI